MTGQRTTSSGKTNNTREKTLNTNKVLPWVFVLFSFILYSNTLNNSYNLDDELVTRNHPLTSKGITGLFDIFTSPYYSDASGNVYEYRPIVLASFAIEHQFFGESPRVSHFLNILLYSILILILFKLLTALFKSYHYLLPLTVTLLFAAHPLHTEVVGSIKNRDEILAMLFAITAMYHAFKYADTERKAYLITSLLFFLLGLLSKKSIMPFALIMPLALIMFRQISLSKILLLTVPLSLMAVVTSHFFYINTRIFLFLAICGLSIFFFYFNKPDFFILLKKGFNDIKLLFKKGHSSEKFQLEEKKIKTFYHVNIIVSGIIFLIAFINSAAILYAVLITYNLFLYIFTSSKFRHYLLLVVAISAAALVVQNGIVSGLMLFAAFLFRNFNYRNRIYQICLVIIILPLIFNFERHMVLLFYFFLLGVIALSWRIRKSKVIPLILSFALTLLFAAINITTQSFENETNFITFTLFLYGISYLNILQKKQPAYVLLLIFIPVTLSGELFITKSYNRPMLFIYTGTLSEAADIMPATGRSLDFAEMPVNKDTPPGIRLGTAAISMAFYMKLLLIPHPLGFYYGFDTIPIVHFTNIWALISLLMHLILICLSLWFFKKNKIVSFSILYYVFCLSIFSNVLAPVAGLIAERLAFAASLGFSIFMGFLIIKLSYKSVELKSKKTKINTLFIVLLSIFITLYSFKTFSRNYHWKSHLTLFENDISYLNRSAQAHNLYAHALMENLQLEKNAKKQLMMLDKAIEHWGYALNIYPEFFNASYNLGKTLYFAKRPEQALSVFQQTFKIDSTDYMVYMYLGIINDELNNHEDALSYYRQTLVLNPLFTDAYTNISALYLKQNKADKAIEINHELLKIKPDSYDALLNIGKINFSNGNLEEALIYFEKAYALNKSDKNLNNALYEINNALGNHEKAGFFKNSK